MVLCFDSSLSLKRTYVCNFLYLYHCPRSTIILRYPDFDVAVTSSIARFRSFALSFNPLGANYMTKSSIMWESSSDEIPSWPVTPWSAQQYFTHWGQHPLVGNASSPLYHVLLIPRFHRCSHPLDLLSNQVSTHWFEFLTR